MLASHTGVPLTRSTTLVAAVPPHLWVCEVAVGVYGLGWPCSASGRRAARTTCLTAPSPCARACS
jgi:hypothetical protein